MPYIAYYNLSAMENYQEAIDYIYSFVNYSMTHQENLDPSNFDLTRMHKFAELLGNPQNDFPVVHIAGSKGKGSVSAFCASILKEAGYKVGLYTSPHMKEFTERFQINGEEIPEEDLVRITTLMKPFIERVPNLSTFEIATVLGFLYFSREKVDIAVIEVGLGGRLDATNIITPILSVITPIYLEHTYVLGDTIRLIAAEKGGIIKPGVPLIIADQSDESTDVLSNIAQERNSPIIKVEEEYKSRIVDKSIVNQEISVDRSVGDSSKEINYTISLLGEHQAQNSVTALAVVDRLNQLGFSLDGTSIISGFERAKWPGRFEVMQESPAVVIDSAHNRDSAEKLRNTIDTYFPGKRVTLIFGVSADKDIDAILSELAPRVESIICTKSTHPRAMEVEELVEKALKHKTEVVGAPDSATAIQMAFQNSKEDEVIMVAGSIFVAASARIAWLDEFQK